MWEVCEKNFQAEEIVRFSIWRQNDFGVFEEQDTPVPAGWLMLRIMPKKSDMPEVRKVGRSHKAL